VDVPADPVRHAQAHRPALVADLDLGEVERVEDQLDGHPDQRGVDLGGVGVQADGGGLGDLPALRPQERLVELGGVGSRGGTSAAVKRASGGWPVSRWARWW
jgi:hypothetical protein